jgi:pimeloyl-ACP methyl ester carboxylesterase
MADRNALRTRTVRPNGIELTTIEAGTGPLALCLHGFPTRPKRGAICFRSSARRVFTQWRRSCGGYAPSAIPADGCYRIGALVADAVALHEVLGADERAVLIAHDWGAEAAYGAAAFAPECWRRVVTIPCPPLRSTPQSSRTTNSSNASSTSCCGLADDGHRRGRAFPPPRETRRGEQANPCLDRPVRPASSRRQIPHRHEWHSR